MSLNQPGEFALIRRLTRNFQKKSGVIGVGDDAAVIPGGSHSLVVTTDMLIEGVHFRRDWMTSREIGRKAVLVNFSDIAAMGSRPLYLFASIALPQNFGVRNAAGLFRGMEEVCRQNGTLILGGDTNRGGLLTVSLTVVGRAEGRRVLRRNGARVGDSIYVTGTLGNSALGLEALSRKKKGCVAFVKAHKEPPNRLAVGRWLARQKSVHSLMDISDGLAGDLKHILEESRVGACVDIDRVPLRPGFLRQAYALGRDPDGLSLGGGEDYELLFTASDGLRMPRQIAGVSVTKIGIIRPARTGLVWMKNGRPYRKRIAGFEHFY